MSRSDTSKLGRKVDRIRCERTPKDGERIADTCHVWRSNTPSGRRMPGPMTTRCATIVAIFPLGPSVHSVEAQRAAPLPESADITGFRNSVMLDDAWKCVTAIAANLKGFGYGG